MMRRSHAPVFWLLFGAGGMLAALIGAALVLLTGLAAPLGWPPALLEHARVFGFAQTVPGRLLLFAVIALFAWHAAHRILCSVHDVGLPKNLAAKLVCYGAALLLSIVAAVALAAL